ncbi:MAG: ribonuclease catalytic domain-containing protein [Planctomycetota bacterium]
MQKALVEFLLDSQIRFGLREESKPKKGISLTEVLSGKKLNLPENKILSLPPFSFSSLADAKVFVKTFEEKIMQEIDGIDVPLLWETLLESPEEGFDWKFAAELYYSQTSFRPEQISAFKRILMNQTMYFKRKGDLYIVKSRELVAQEKTRQKQTLANQERRDLVNKQIEVLGKFQANPSDPAIQELLEMLSSCLWKREKEPQFTYYKNLLEENAQPFLPFCYRVLKHYQKINPALEPELLFRGVSESFSEEVNKAAMDLAQKPLDGRPLPEEGMCFSMDDQETREKDDAIYFKPLASGGWLLGILIANVSAYVSPETLVDRCAQERGTTYYLPDRVLPMIPESLSCSQCSLEEGEDRAVLGGWFELSSEGTILNFTIESNRMRSQGSLTYEMLDRWLSNDFSEVDRDWMKFVHNTGKSSQDLKFYWRELISFGQKLCQKRVQNGAVSIHRKEFSIKVKQEEIQVKCIKSKSHSYSLIAEMMILINTSLAEYARTNQIPMIYRCQDKPNQNLPAIAETEENPATLEKIFRQLKPSRLSTKPEPHFALGVPCYVQISSPIRRYVDLVLQRQILHVLNTQKALYTEQELLEIYMLAEVQSKQSREVEQICKERWFKKWLKPFLQKTPIPAYLLEPMGSNQRVELANCGLLAILQGTTTAEPGALIEVLITHLPNNHYPRVRIATGTFQANDIELEDEFPELPTGKILEEEAP